MQRPTAPHVFQHRRLYRRNISSECGLRRSTPARSFNLQPTNEIQSCERTVGCHDPELELHCRQLDHRSLWKCKHADQHGLPSITWSSAEVGQKGESASTQNPPTESQHGRQRLKRRVSNKNGQSNEYPTHRPEYPVIMGPVSRIPHYLKQYSGVIVSTRPLTFHPASRVFKIMRFRASTFVYVRFHLLLGRIPGPCSTCSKSQIIRQRRVFSECGEEFAKTAGDLLPATRSTLA